ncbi:hypothetical protein [Sphingomonas sp. GB1N7]
MGDSLAENNSVILNLFQDPGAYVCQMNGVSGAGDRAWMLKQVQHDGAF